MKPIGWLLIALFSAWPGWQAYAQSGTGGCTMHEYLTQDKVNGACEQYYGSVPASVNGGFITAWRDLPGDSSSGCGVCIKVTSLKTSKSVNVLVVDRGGAMGLDLSQTAINAIDSDWAAAGNTPCQWEVVASSNCQGASSSPSANSTAAGASLGMPDNRTSGPGNNATVGLGNSTVTVLPNNTAARLPSNTSASLPNNNTAAQLANNNNTATQLPNNNTATQLPNNNTATQLPNNNTATQLPNNNTAAQLPNNNTAAQLATNAASTPPINIAAAIPPVNTAAGKPTGTSVSSYPSSGVLNNTPRSNPAGIAVNSPNSMTITAQTSGGGGTFFGSISAQTGRLSTDQDGSSSNDETDSEEGDSAVDDESPEGESFPEPEDDEHDDVNKA